MTPLLLLLSTNNDLFLLFWNRVFLLHWHTISRADLCRYLSAIKGTIRDQAYSAPTPTTTAVLLKTFNSLPWQQRVNHSPCSVTSKPQTHSVTKHKENFPFLGEPTFLSILKFSGHYPSKLLCTAHVYQIRCTAGFSSSVIEAQVDP